MIIERITRYDVHLLQLLYARTGVKMERFNAAFFGDDKNILLVAYSGAKPSGYLYAYVLPSLEDDKPRVFLYSIDVFEEYRNKGVGSRLIGEMKDIAKRLGCRKVFGVTNRSNLAAMRMFERSGGTTEHDDDVVFVFR